jgi:hypothetical protein
MVAKQQMIVGIAMVMGRNGNCNDRVQLTSDILLVAGLKEPESVSNPEPSDRIERFDEFVDLPTRDFGLEACCSVRLRESLG